ncbi:sigma-G-dependent sporulation-specific acid-soluble spore protein CsgA [Niallia endozanthoxylica]|uniref:Sporulation protein n=1 Tax=Niallia endozanthoxylica TaxID=2036016 RepID=A0A5J5HVG0_9BACI|nr:sigma-G-dependent sporulation-specific acid-soluble spore protein CsgA [Niallia endozanthoxylica]KAA9025663.1 sporulation protein [Niallia endozanthoxylica]
MDQSLEYLREILSGHTENDQVGKNLYAKICSHQYASEGKFVRELTQEENDYLNQILTEAIDYSKQEKDYVRARHLNEVYELLLV